MNDVLAFLLSFALMPAIILVGAYKLVRDNERESDQCRAARAAARLKAAEPRSAPAPAPEAVGVTD